MAKFTLSKIGDKTPKGNVALSVLITQGLVTNPEPYFVLSNPEAVKEAGIKVGDDLTEHLKDTDIRESKMVGDDGEERTFYWLVPKVG